MQTFKDSVTNNVWEFDDDVVVTNTAGTYSFTAVHGMTLNAPSTLQPYVTPTPTAAQLLAAAQTAQTATVTASCGAAILAGFQSSALGAAYTYPAKPIDQSNLIGCVTVSLAPGLASTWACNFWCEDGLGVWALRAHTAAQIQKVLADGATQRESYSAKLNSLVQQIIAATSVSAVQAVVW